MRGNYLLSAKTSSLEGEGEHLGILVMRWVAHRTTLPLGM